MKVAVATDANSSFTKKQAEELGVFFMDMPVIIDGEDYIQDVNLTTEMFYKAQADGRDVSTSQPAPGAVMDFWDTILDSGYDQIVYIPMSSGLSASCDTAKALSEDYDGKVCVCDNHRISGTQSQSVMDALAMAEAGYSAQYIMERLEDTAYEASIYIAVDTLKYLVKGGRVTPAGAALGTALGIKPVLTIQGGKLDAFAKLRGMAKCESKMIEAVKADIENRFSNIKREDMFMFTAGTVMNEEEQIKWTNTVNETFGMNAKYAPLSLSIGAHIGAGSLALGIARKFYK